MKPFTPDDLRQIAADAMRCVHALRRAVEMTRGPELNFALPDEEVQRNLDLLSMADHIEALVLLRREVETLDLVDAAYQQAEVQLRICGVIPYNAVVTAEEPEGLPT